MKPLRLASVVLIALIAPTGSLGSSQSKSGPKPRVEITDTETVPFVSRGTIDFKGSYGEVRVRGWDRPEVAVTLTRSLATDDTPEDRTNKEKRLKEARLSAARQSPDRLAISAKAPSPWFHESMRLAYDIKIPRESDLYIKFSAGEINCTGVIGEISITEHAGEISVSLPEGEYAIDARARIGDVSSQFPVRARRPHLIGATATGAKGVESPSVYLRVGVGQINVIKTPHASPKASP